MSVAPIRHHPSETTLLGYAAGGLPEALALVVATHLGRCAACRDTVGAMEAVGGALLESLPPAEVSLDTFMLDRLLERAETPRAPVAPVLHPDMAPPLNRVPMGRWWPVGRGIRFRPLRVGGAAWGGLLLAQPGRALPRHGHDGRELTCLLAGAFADGGEDYTVPGDVAEPEGDHDDPPVAIGSEPCLCLVASEGLRLRGLLGVAQRLGGW